MLRPVKRHAALFITISSIFLPLTADAADSISIEAANGDRTNIFRVAAQWQWNKKWFQSNGTHLGGYWDVGAAYWRQNRYLDQRGNTNGLYDLGITPVFRFQSDHKLGWYLEAGIGAHYLSELYNNNGARLSTRFQFGDHIGIGYVLGNNLDIGLRIQHYSNGGFKKPNTGVDVAVLRVAYQF